MPPAETAWMWGGICCYAAAAFCAWQAQYTRRRKDFAVLCLTGAGAVALGVSITARWQRVGYGPFLTMYEILLSNLFSLGLIFAVVGWRVRKARPAALVVLPLLVMLGLWIVTVSAEPDRLPASYDNPWLWLHVGVGKIFLGTCLVAVGLAGVLLLQRTPAGRGLIQSSEAHLLDSLAWRFMAVAFLFHSMMLIAGAVWAEDAWGRYWDWDPLETWAFVTWLAIGAALHVRVTFRVPAPAGWLMIIAIFVLAFLTFFGVPFLSLAPHKGVM